MELIIMNKNKFFFLYLKHPQYIRGKRYGIPASGRRIFRTIRRGWSTAPAQGGSPGETPSRTRLSWAHPAERP